MTTVTVSDDALPAASLDVLRSRAAEALGYAALDPARAVALGSPVIESARRVAAWDVVAMAERALGVAAMNRSDMDEAVRRLTAAVQSAHRAGALRALGEARMSLAAALVLHGMSSRALREINAALGDLDGVYAARARVQHAAILQELGRNEEALGALRGALPVLRRTDDGEWTVRALSNRSLIHVERRAFGSAESDLLEALRHCDAHDLGLPAAYAEQNLGCLDAQRGQVPDALRHFDRAEQRYEEYGLVEPSVLVDRARVLMSVRLLDEARAAADAAVGAYRSQRRHVHVPDAQLLQSTVALLQGDRETAATAARAAAQGFRRRGRPGSEALAKYAAAQARMGDGRGSAGPGGIARIADELAAGGWEVQALDARVLAGRLALERGQREQARRHLSEASRARFTGPAEIRARAWLAEALLRRADGRRVGARSALRAGLRILSQHQVSLGASELRAHAGAHRGALARTGLRMALEDRNARAVLWWADRDRANALLVRPARPPEDPALAQDLADLRSTMVEIEEARAEAESGLRLVQRQVRLEHRIRDRVRTLGATGDVVVHGSLAETVSVVGDDVLVEFIEMDDAVSAVTVSGGRVRVHHLCSLGEVRDAQAHLPFALHRLAQPRNGAKGAAAMAVLSHVAEMLDGLLLRPLARVMGDRPLIIVPSSSVQSVPWSILPSCAGRPVTVSPSASSWHRVATAPPPSADAPVVVVAGPGLRGARTEAQTVARIYGRATVLVGDSAIASAVVEGIEGAGHVHLAAHGTIRADNPLFSSVLLADGPLTVYEFEHLARAPHRVTMAACDTGRPQSMAGAEILGFAAALLGAGTTTLVAPVVPVSDAATVGLMVAYHSHLVAGRSPSVALAEAQAGIDVADPQSVAAAAAFVCVGAG